MTARVCAACGADIPISETAFYLELAPAARNLLGDVRRVVAGPYCAACEPRSADPPQAPNI